jgi:RNA polymerase sigma factor (sigma-70 family)
MESMTSRTDRHDVSFYEGLCRKTASMYVPFVEEEYEDIVQILRVKVWRALETFDPARSKMPVERYVFMCVKNQCKDLVKKRKRGEKYIEDIAPTTGELPLRDSFDERYLSATHEEIYGLVDEGDPLVPSTLTPTEKQVVCLLYRSYRQTEAARLLGLTRSEMERCIAAIRMKMADWHPGTALQPQLAA